MSYAFQQDVVLLLSPILHRMLRFANLHPECRNKYKKGGGVALPRGPSIKSLPRSLEASRCLGGNREAKSICFIFE